MRYVPRFKLYYWGNGTLRLVEESSGTLDELVKRYKVSLIEHVIESAGDLVKKIAGNTKDVEVLSTWTDWGDTITIGYRDGSMARSLEIKVRVDRMPISEFTESEDYQRIVESLEEPADSIRRVCKIKVYPVMEWIGEPGNSKWRVINNITIVEGYLILVGAQRYYVVTPERTEEVRGSEVEEKVDEILLETFRESAKNYVDECEEIDYGVNFVSCDGELVEWTYTPDTEDKGEFLEEIGLDPEDVEEIYFVETPAEVITDWYLIVSRSPPHKNEAL